MDNVKTRGELEFIITFILVAISLYLISWATLTVGLLIGMAFNYKKIKDSVPL